MAMPGVGTALVGLLSLIGEGRLLAFLSGAILVASAKPGIGGARRLRSSTEGVIWPLSVTVVRRERDRDRDIPLGNASLFFRREFGGGFR
jgi:hypothetical protein